MPHCGHRFGCGPRLRGKLQILLFALLGACASSPEPYVDPRIERDRVGQEMLVAGERVRVGAPVVLWFEGPRYSAYDTVPRFSSDGPKGLRYRAGREAVGPQPDRSELESVVDQFVLHYDACGLSQACFRVLHDERKLSVHFMLDVDGTIYQTMDLVDTAWHARQANARSIGIEIANPGAYAPGLESPLDRWYVEDEAGLRLDIPARLGDGGVRTPGFVARPARPGRIEGAAQGGRFEQVDFTDAQYESLARLTAALVRTFPKLPLAVPRDSHGQVLTVRMSPEREKSFTGLVGHLHVSSQRRDPGPAFDWERLLSEAWRLLN